jgi:hypothetical protein
MTTTHNRCGLEDLAVYVTAVYKIDFKQRSQGYFPLYVQNWHLPLLGSRVKSLDPDEKERVAVSKIKYRVKV